MLPILKEYANKKQLYGFITTYGDTFKLIILDSATENIVTNISYQAKDAESLIKQFSSTFGINTFKAIIVELYELPMNKTKYLTSYNYCKELKKKFNDLKIPSYFIGNENYLFTSLLIAGNVGSVDIDDTVLLVIPCQKGSAKDFMLMIVELKFTPKGYQQIGQIVHENDTKINHEEFCRRLCGDSNPRKIVVSGFQCKHIPFRKIFSSKDVVILTEGASSNHEKFIVEACKWLLEKSYVQNYILPICVKSVHAYAAYAAYGPKIMDIIKVNINEPLPISKTLTFTRCIPQFFLMYEDKKAKFGQQMGLYKNCHAYKITVTIDEENFEETNVVPISLYSVRELPSKMDILLESKVPFIGLYENSSVIGIYNKEKERYEFLDEWNGQYGINCFISFDQKKPKFGQEAMDSLRSKNTFVVFDLLKIMSMTLNNIKMDKIWGFTFTSDANNPVLLEFDNFDGTKKAASPAFLMAMYLRQHLKAIEAKVGEKPKEIGVWFLNRFEGFEEELEDDEMNRIKEGLKESCRLLKLDAHIIHPRFAGIDFVGFYPFESV